MSSRVGYNVRVHTLKYAQWLIHQWNQKELDGIVLQCQIELNPVNRARSMDRRCDNTGSRPRSESRSFAAKTNRGPRDPSISRRDDRLAPMSFVDREEGREGRMMRPALPNGKTRPAPTIPKPSANNEIEGKLFAGQCSSLDQISFYFSCVEGIEQSMGNSCTRVDG